METNSRLISAVKKGSQDEIATLLLNGADVNAIDEHGNTPIIYAIENSDPIITRILLTNRANVKDPKVLNTAVSFGVDEKSMDIVKSILEYGACVNAADEYGRTPLHFIPIIKGDFDLDGFDPEYSEDCPVKRQIVELLLSRGANVNAETKSGETALHVAAQRGYSTVVETLLKHNADINAKTKCNIIPLHAAIQGSYNHQEYSVRVLLKYGADVNCIQEENGRTALHIACEWGKDGVIKVLLECGADINIRDKQDNTPLEIFFSEFYSFFEDYMSDDYDYYYEREVTSARNIPVIFKEHMNEMKNENLYINEKNFMWFIKTNYDGQSDLFETEIQAMKDAKLNNSNVSFYDILMKNPRRLAIHARNESIVKVLKSDDFKAKFPMYVDAAKNNLRRGLIIKEMLERGCEIFNSFSPQLPCECSEKILGHVSDRDLKSFIKALSEES